MQTDEIHVTLLAKDIQKYYQFYRRKYCVPGKRSVRLVLDSFSCGQVWWISVGLTFKWICIGVYYL